MATVPPTAPPTAAPPRTASPIGPPTGPAAPFPLFVSGRVIRGFGRGSKELGIPTANISVDDEGVVGRRRRSGNSSNGIAAADDDDDDDTGLLARNGVYFGWAGLHDRHQDVGVDGVFPMVMSVGWNPFYKNTVRSIEVHLLSTFAQDFYGAELRLLVLGYIRPEADYVSKEALIADIEMDIDVARRSLDREAYRAFSKDERLVPGLS